MANVTFDIQWREAMMELLDLLELERPEDPSLAPKDLAEWSCIYIKYIQTFRKLEEAYDQMVHPQKRTELKKALESVIGRVLEIKAWMVKLNKDIDFVNMDDILVDIKLPPAVLEVPVPRYFVEERHKELEDRSKFLEALVEKYNLPKKEDPPVVPVPPLSEDDAIKVLQVNERGRQGRERARVMQAIKRQQQLGERAQQFGRMSPEVAAVKIQSLVRSYLARCRVQAEAAGELIFIGMRPAPREPSADPAAKAAKNLAMRKLVQVENQVEYEKAIIASKLRVAELEGQDMREMIQDKINAWFIEARNPETGEYPEFPAAEDGGSKSILNPPPKEPEPEPAAADAKGGKDAKKDAKKDPKKDAKAAEAAPAEVKKEEVGTEFVRRIEAAVAEYARTWQEKDEAGNFFQKHDAEMVLEALRPVVFEEVRGAVDEEMRSLLQNLKDMVEAERAARTGKKTKPKKGKKGGKKEKKAKGKKDPTADRSMESLYAELVSNNIIQPAPRRAVADYIGDCTYLAATMEKAGIVPDPSMAQVRQAVTEYCILPLGSQAVHEKAPLIKAVLLYGHKQTGKTLLSHAVATAAGANFFDLTPMTTDGKYTGKSVAMLMHMVFKVARTMAPSVIYIDEVEKVFVSDKKKLKAYQAATGAQEATSRIKKDLLKEFKTLVPGDRVLVLGNSAEPFECQKKDLTAITAFFQKYIYVPLPDYASIRLLWPGLCARNGGAMHYGFDLSALAHISQGFTAGAMQQVCRGVLTPRRIEMLAKKPLTMKEMVRELAKHVPVQKEADQALREWTMKLPNRAAKVEEKAAEPAAKGKKK